MTAQRDEQSKSKPGRPAPWLETVRLQMREFVPADYDDLWRLGRDPRVMRYLGDGKPMTREATARQLLRIMGYGKLYPDFGIWHTSRRDTGKFIGWFSLKYAGKSPDVEVGYWLLPDAWGHGFATEGAQAMVDYGFDDLGLHKIIGVTHRGNKASQHVLMKAGLEDVGWGDYYDKRLRLFVAERSPG